MGGTIIALLGHDPRQVEIRWIAADAEFFLSLSSGT